LRASPAGGYNPAMLRFRALALPLAVFTLIALIITTGPAGCKPKDETLSTDPLELIPAEIQGIYGRTTDDAPGMTVSGTGLSLGEMQFTIHQGKMEGSTVRIERATLKWAKLDEPKTCNGTLSRQGDQLLLTLYDSNKDGAKCESMLDAKWLRWEPLDTLPELIRGRYGALLVEENGMRLDIEGVHAEMQVETIRELPGSNDERVEVLITAAKVVGDALDFNEPPETVECTGTMKLAEGRMDTDFWVPAPLVLTPGSEDAKDPAKQAKFAANEEHCNRWDGSAFKWEVRMDNLPKQPIKFGALSLTVTPKQVVLDSPHLRCEQELWRTESVDSQAGWAGVQVGGERMTLSRAEPKQVSDECKLKLRIWCEQQEGGDPTNIDPASEPAEHIAACIDFTQQQLCPESITVRAISDVRWKVHVEPPSFNAIACVDPTGDFQL
jgi:hypothetical protein